MADKITPLILEGLAKAAAFPSGLPLHGTKKQPGLFTTTASSKSAAALALREGYLHILEHEANGKRNLEVSRATEKGLTFLLDQVGPRRVLAELLIAVQTQQSSLRSLSETAEKLRAANDQLCRRMERTLEKIDHPGASIASNGEVATRSDGSANSLAAVLMTHLSEWQAAGHPVDCALPDLYQHVARGKCHLSIGQFHDALRHLHHESRIYLHPWTGPLHELPQPSFALLVGHEIAYYASTR